MGSRREHLVLVVLAFENGGPPQGYKQASAAGTKCCDAWDVARQSGGADSQLPQESRAGAEAASKEELQVPPGRPALGAQAQLDKGQDDAGTVAAESLMTRNDLPQILPAPPGFEQWFSVQGAAPEKRPVDNDEAEQANQGAEDPLGQGSEIGDAASEKASCQESQGELFYEAEENVVVGNRPDYLNLFSRLAG